MFAESVIVPLDAYCAEVSFLLVDHPTTVNSVLYGLFPLFLTEADVDWSLLFVPGAFGISGAVTVHDVAPLYKLHEAVVSVAHVALLYLNVATKPYFHTAYNVIELPLVIPATSC